MSAFQTDFHGYHVVVQMRSKISISHILFQDLKILMVKLLDEQSH